MSDDLRALLIHAIAYCVVNTLLIIIDHATSPDAYWFYWALGGWGVGLAAHAAAVFLAMRARR